MGWLLALNDANLIGRNMPRGVIRQGRGRREMGGDVGRCGEMWGDGGRWRTCVAAPPRESSMRVVMSAAAPFSSRVDEAPSQK